MFKYLELGVSAIFQLVQAAKDGQITVDEVLKIVESVLTEVGITIIKL